ncbi:DUF2235 domain-containing protein [Aliiroseovarius subalbicans]|uniref:DUF2235 domain-containing protein n=1 Tax=Aliiroseovarius subalbicans TaxID=2925840 RepID=UPI001F5A9F4F|nr:DUF2235 domain-containing protein [Aliiroseovarius subalbicans]MCI2399041.1 DUF2235 domain-containing protein [Aliiroseovarius subalbicans]
MIKERQQVFRRLRTWLAGKVRTRTEPRPVRGQVDHVVILDGTLSTLEPGDETNAGLTYKLLCECAPSARLSILYEAGIQWETWKHSWHVATGVGINRQIRRAYGFLASRYRPGDRIFLLGYSRGAFAVRSLAGVIDQVGLLTAVHATERNIRDVYRHYQCSPNSDAAAVFAKSYCHAEAPIEMVGVWDTVKALGLRWPLVWRLFEPQHRFHSTHLGGSIHHGYHALALDETREAFEPVLWACDPGFTGRVEQVWFRGAHGDIGGQLGGFDAARPLSNIPLVWMLGKMEGCGVALPPGWRAGFPCNPGAPSVGTLRGWGKMFVHRRKRRVGGDPSERLFSARPVSPVS